MAGEFLPASTGTTTVVPAGFLAAAYLAADGVTAQPPATVLPVPGGYMLWVQTDAAVPLAGGDLVLDGGQFDDFVSTTNGGFF